MPSPPSPSADHFAAAIADVQADSRLSLAKKRLLIRSIRRARSDFLHAPDLFTQLVATWLRCYWQILAAPPDAATTLRATDGLTRLAGRLGLLDRNFLRKGGSFAGKHGRMTPPSRTC